MPNFKSDVFGVIPHDVSSPVGTTTPSGISIFVVAFDDTKIVNKVGEYTLTATDITNIGTSLNKAYIEADSDVSENDLAGLWLWVDGHSENYVIAANTAATSGNLIEVTLEDEVSTALLESDVVKVRNFKGFKYASRHGSMDSFLETYFSLNSDGDYDVDTSKVGYYGIRSYVRNGGQVFYVMPVEFSSTKATLLSNLDVTGDSTALTQLQIISDANFMAVPKGYSPSTSILDSEYATLDGAYVDYVESRAVATSGDKRRMHYMFGIMSNTISAATTYMSTLNKNSFRASSIFPSMKVRPFSGIELVKIDSVCAFCGVGGKIHSLSPNREGQAIAGQQDSQMSDVVKLSVELTRPDLVSLQAAQINTMVNFNGFYIHGDFTNITTTGKIERNAHIVHAANRISNSVIPFAETFTMKPNTSTQRLAIKQGFESICQLAVNDGAIVEFSVRDLTSTLDIQNNIARWSIKIRHVGVIEYLDITFSSSLGQL